MVETLRKMIRQQTVKPPALPTNIYGAVPGESPPLVAGAPQRWLWAQAPSRSLPSIEEFYAAFITAGYDAREVQGENGVVIVRSATSQLHLLRGVITVPTQMTVPISVATGSTVGEFIVYVGGVLQRRAVDAVELQVSLGRGQHLIEVLAFSESLGIAVPPELEVSAMVDKLPAPQWREVTSGYMDPALGLAAVNLSWYNDVRAGGWRLFRREQDVLGIIQTVGDADVRGEFGLTFSGDQTPLLSAGEEISAGTATMGTVLSSLYDALTDLTSVRVKLELNRTVTDPDWVGRPSGSGRFKELTTITRTGNQSVVKYDDLQVRVGTVYEYRLQAYGMMDRLSLSPWSSVEYVRAGDIYPPGPIQFISPYPRAEGRRVAVRFLAPTDEDYAGVRVYFNHLVHSGSSGTLTSAHLLDAAQSWLTNQYVGHLLYMSGAALPSGGTFLISSNDATHLYTEFGFQGLVSEGTTLPYEVRFEQLVLTDFGKPGAEDQFAYETITSGGVVLSGDYVFRSFDYTGNELGVDSPRWTFDGKLSNIGVPNPIVGPLYAEALAADSSPADGIPDGMVYIPITFDKYTKEVWIYAAEAETSPVPTPSTTDDNRRSAVIVRQPGDYSSEETWGTLHKISTTPNWYRRIVCVGVGFDGVKGEPQVLEVQAASSGLPPSQPTDFTQTPLPAEQSGYTLSWTAADPGYFTLVLRNQIVLAIWPAGSGTFVDSGIPIGVPYDYAVQHFTFQGRVSAQVQASLGGTVLVELDPIAWYNGTPSTAVGNFGTGVGAINLSIQDANAHLTGDHLYIDVFMSTGDGSGIYNVVKIYDIGTLLSNVAVGQVYTFQVTGIAGETRQFYARLRRVRGGTTKYTAATQVGTAMFSDRPDAPAISVVGEIQFGEPVAKITVSGAPGLQKRIYENVDGAGWNLLTTLSASIATFTTPVAYGVEHCYYATALNAYGESDPSSTDCVTVNP